MKTAKVFPLKCFAVYGMRSRTLRSHAYISLKSLMAVPESLVFSYTELETCFLAFCSTKSKQTRNCKAPTYIIVKYIEIYLSKLHIGSIEVHIGSIEGHDVI